MLDCELFGMSPAGHHATSVLLHLLDALLLFGVLARMTGAPWRAAVVACLFAVHPLHVESVAWVAERKDVLSTLFWMLALWAYLRFVERPGAGRYLLVALALAAGFMAKATVVTLPAVLLLLDYWPLGRWTRGGYTRLLLEKLPLAALAGLASVVAFLAQRRGGTMTATDVLPVAARVAHALVAYVAYVAKALWPSRLAVFYPYPPAPPAWQVAGAGLALVVASLLVARAAHRHPYLVLGWGWYLVTLLPVIGLVQIGMQSIADRYTYVPLTGLFIVVAWGVPDLLAGRAWRRGALALAAAVAIGAAFAATRLQLRHWRDDFTLYEHALAVTSGNFLAHNNLGLALVGAGRMTEAAAHFDEALRLKPRYLDARNNLAGALFTQGRTAEAMAQYSEVLRVAPDFAPAHRNLGAALAREGRLDEANAHYAEAARLEARQAAAR